MKTKILLLTVFTLLITAACNTSNQKEQPSETSAAVSNIEVVYHVDGMTCEHCEMSIVKGIKELDGIAKVEANHEDSTTLVIFDPSKTDKKQIAAAIEKRGYKVVE